MPGLPAGGVAAAPRQPSLPNVSTSPVREPAAPVSAAASPASHPRLVADIGGTNARFGWVAAPGAPVSQVRRLAVPDFAGPAEAAQAYLAGLAGAHGGDARAPVHAAFAVATAVGGDRITLKLARGGGAAIRFVPLE